MGIEPLGFEEHGHLFFDPEVESFGGVGDWDFDEPCVAVDFGGFAEQAGVGPPEKGEGEVVPVHATLCNFVVRLEGGVGEVVVGGSV